MKRYITLEGITLPLDFAGFESSIKATEKLRKACKALGLDEAQCKKLEPYVGEVCGVLIEGGKAGKTRRKLSKWQLCIKERRAGKPFDPTAIKALAGEYRAGRCPSGT